MCAFGCGGVNTSEHGGDLQAGAPRWRRAGARQLHSRPGQTDGVLSDGAIFPLRERSGLNQEGKCIFLKYRIPKVTLERMWTPPPRTAQVSLANSWEHVRLLHGCG